MLHDVFHILRIPVEGRTVSATGGTTDLQAAFCALLRVPTVAELMNKHKVIWDNGGVLVESILSRCKDDGRTPDT